MYTIDPAPGQFKAAMNHVPMDTPIMMLNMLRFREQALYTSDVQVEPCSGREAYQRYSDASFEKIKATGASINFRSKSLFSMIAPEDETWDEIFIVKWPKFKDFLDVILSEEYQKGTYHRTAALLDSRLIMLESL